MKNKSVIPIERIEGTIYLVRSQKAVLDKDLALLYWGGNTRSQSSGSAQKKGGAAIKRK